MIEGYADLNPGRKLTQRLQHSNIVKYHGFVKSAETLNIILECVSTR